MMNNTTSHQLSHDDLWQLTIDNALQNISVPLEDGFYNHLYMATAVYANLYLENNLHGDKTQQGRFYWAAFAAFTHLHLWQVMAEGADDETTSSTERDLSTFHSLFDIRSLNAEQIKTKYQDKTYTDQISAALQMDLNKFTFWQAIDLLSTHFFFQADPDALSIAHTKQAVYSHAENEHTSLSQKVWFDEVRQTLIDSNLSPSLYRAFDCLRRYTAEDNALMRVDLQFNHLISLSEHIQQQLAQPLLYGKHGALPHIHQLNRHIRHLTDDQTYALLPFPDTAPDLKTHYPDADTDTDADAFASFATLPQHAAVNSYAVRMKVLKEEAEKFHYLMQHCSDWMHQHISDLAALISFNNHNEHTS